MANVGISLWRGDFFGAAISGISIIPIGNVLKLAKLDKYAKTFETLVQRVIPNNPSLYEELTPLMESFRSVMARIPGGNKAVETIREQITKFFKNAELRRLASGMSGLEALAKLAERRGRWAVDAYAKGGTSPSDVVERLLNAAGEGNNRYSVRMNAKKMIEQMSDKDWVISAGPHKTTSTVGMVLDKTPHITLEIAGQPHAYHLRLDAKGHIWEIRTIDGGRPINPIPRTPRPWKGPGQ